MNIHAVYKPFQLWFRRGRMAKFERKMGLSDKASIVDLGGTPFNWALVRAKPSITLVNLDGEAKKEGNITAIVCDGKRTPFSDNEFDICFSNSVIEHVGPWPDMVQFATEIRRLAPRYWVQTPNRYFPVEPHFLCIGLHWLPLRARMWAVRHFSGWALITKPSRETAEQMVKDIRLLSVREMRELFPDAEIVRERFFGLTKSIVAVRA